MTRLDSLNLPKSVQRRLLRAHIRTVEDLQTKTEYDLVKLPGISSHKAMIIRDKLEEYRRSSRTGKVRRSDSPSTDIRVLNLPRRIDTQLRLKMLHTVERLVEIDEDALYAIVDLSPANFHELQHRLSAYLSQESEPKATPISQLNLSTRTYNALCRAGVHTQERLATMSDDDLLRIRQFGAKSLTEVREVLVACRSVPSTAEQVSPPAACPSPEEVLEYLLVKTPLDQLGLPVRAYNALQRWGIDTIEHLVLLNDEQLLEVRNFGAKSLEETRSKLAIYLEKHPLAPEFAELSVDYRESGQQQLPFQGAKPSEVLGEEVAHLVDPQLLNQVSHVPLDIISIARLGLPSYLTAELLERQIQSVRALVVQDRAVLAEGELIGDRLDWYLRWLLIKDENTWQNEIEGANLSPVYEHALRSRSIQSYFGEWFAVLSEREQQVVQGRYGLQTEELTLEEMGEQLGVTRERVRQIQKKAERLLAHPLAFRMVAPLVGSFWYVLNSVGGLANLRDFDRVLRKYLMLDNYRLAGVLGLILEIDDRVERLRREGAWLRRGIAPSEIRWTQKLLAAFLDESGVPLSTRQLVEQVKSTDFYQRHSKALNDDMIEACLRVHPRLRKRGDEWYLRKRSWQHLAAIIRALREIGEPAHYEEIAERANAFLPQHLARTPHNIHAELGRRPEVFVRVGHGVFGLAEWGLNDDGCVANAAYRILAEAGKPLHYTVITNQVLETWRVRPESVYAALNTDARFRCIGSGVFWLVEREVSQEDLEFGGLFGARLAQMQKEIDRWSNGTEYDTHAEVDRIREVGTDIFRE